MSTDLFDHVQNQNQLDPALVTEWLRQTLTGLDYLHTDAHFAHLDLKPNNLLLTPNNNIKISDFGLAVSLPATASHRGGTPGYTAPELLIRHTIPTAAADIWSLAVTFFEIMKGDYMMQQNITLQTTKALAWNIPTQRKFNPEPEFSRTCASMFVLKPEFRPTAHQLLFMLSSAKLENCLRDQSLKLQAKQQEIATKQVEIASKQQEIGNLHHAVHDLVRERDTALNNHNQIRAQHETILLQRDQLARQINPLVAQRDDALNQVEEMRNQLEQVRNLAAVDQAHHLNREADLEAYVAELEADLLAIPLPPQAAASFNDDVQMAEPIPERDDQLDQIAASFHMIKRADAPNFLLTARKDAADLLELARHPELKNDLLMHVYVRFLDFQKGAPYSSFELLALFTFFIFGNRSKKGAITLFSSFSLRGKESARGLIRANAQLFTRPQE